MNRVSYNFSAEFKQQLSDREKHLNGVIEKMQTELDDCRSHVTVLSLELQSKLEGETRKYRELSSLQHLLNGAVIINNLLPNSNYDR